MKYYSINEFSKILGVSAQTLRNWDNNGKLHPHHTSNNGYRYYSHEQLNQVMNKDFILKDDKLDTIFINTIITICNLYKDSVTNETKDKINLIISSLESEVIKDDKGNKGNVNT